MKKLIIGNWKMQLTAKAAVRLVKQINNLESLTKVIDLVLCPSFTALAIVAALKRKSYKLGAQDLFWVGGGAYTGEISPLDLKEIGCRFVIIGHSERRQFLGESNEMVGKKVKAALEAGLTPVLCVGENASERANHQEQTVVKEQLVGALEAVKERLRLNLIIAYEPVWAIGTGRTPLSSEIQAMHRFIFSELKSLLTEDAQIKVIYGGSVDANNIVDFLKLPEVAGSLVGGASSNFNKFKALLKELQTLNPKP